MKISRMIVLIAISLAVLLLDDERAASSDAQEIAPAQSRLGMNLSGPADWNTEHPFVDVFRLSRQWVSQRQGQRWGQGPKLECDARGWIKKLEPDCWAETPLLTGGHAPGGEYVCLYDGEGTIDFNHNATIVSREPGRIVVNIDARQSGTFLALRRTSLENPVRHIRVLMPGFEKTCQTEPFHPVFLNRWRGFNTFRFMDWQETNGSRQKDWADRPWPGDATWTAKGIPVEVMVDLCNRLKINPWFCLPHLVTDDYVRQFATLVKRTLDPSLKIYVEYSNEIWNGMFAQTKYAGDEGLRLGLGQKHWEAGWHYSAARSVQIFRIWEEVLGGKDRLVRVIASQAANPYVSEQKLKFQDAYKQCDALAIAPYISFNVPAKAEKGRLDASTVAAWSLDQLLFHAEQKALPECIRWMTESRKVADKYGVKLLAYEAGQHLVGVQGGENNDALTKLFHAANRHPRMGQIYSRYLDAWKQTGGGLCCIFASTSAWSKWGSWGLLEYADQTEDDVPKCKAVLEWNRKNPWK